MTTSLRHISGPCTISLPPTSPVESPPTSVQSTISPVSSDIECSTPPPPRSGTIEALSSSDTSSCSTLPSSLEDFDVPMEEDDCISSVEEDSSSSKSELLEESAMMSEEEEPTRADISSVQDYFPGHFSSGLKIVFDNVDKNVKPRFMRFDEQTKSLHYVNIYAMLDRIDFSHLSAEIPTRPNMFDILPNKDDYKVLKRNFSIHVARVMVEHLAFFHEDFKGLLPDHIPHKYSTEMSMKSEIVCLNLHYPEIHSYNALS